MFERFTDTARHLLAQAQANARRLGHSYIGCEHLLMAAAGADEPVGAVLRDQNVTPERIEPDLLHITLWSPCAASTTRRWLPSASTSTRSAPGSRRRSARTRSSRALPADGPRRPAWGKGPLAELTRRRHRRHASRTPAARRNAPQPTGPVSSATPLPGPAPRSHIPFTPRAKKTLELSLREAEALHDGSIGAQHITLALLILHDGTVPGSWRPSASAGIGARRDP